MIKPSVKRAARIWRAAAGTLFLLAAGPPAAYGNVQLPSIFGDHMVLQCDAVLPVWGWADAGEAVTVGIAGQSQAVTADTDGKWRIQLSKVATAVDQTLTVKGKNTIVISDVSVGEVWICSGQSNMDLRLKDARNAAEEIAAADEPQIRSFNVAKVTSQPKPMENVAGRWEICSPAVAGDVSAVGYFFARDLHKSLGKPVGIIHTSVGATNAEAWTSAEGLAADPELKALRDTQIATVMDYPQASKRFIAAMADWEARYGQDTGNQGEGQGWARPGFDDSSWGKATVPTNFAKLGIKTGGSVWFRKNMEIPAAAAGKGFTLFLGGGADDKTIYFNGEKLAVSLRNPWFFQQNLFVPVPGELVHAGTNTIALRVYAHRYDGGISPFQDKLGLGIPGLESGSEIATWLYHLEKAGPPLSAQANAAYPVQPKNFSAATVLYNGMVHPLIPYAIRGVVWYQGETQHRGFQYRRLLPALIQDWRTHWGQGNFPFYIVQLANYWPEHKDPGPSGWAELREAQSLAAANVPDSGIAVSIDLGETANVHPKNKRDVGHRLALTALAKTYGRHVEYSGPLYESMTVEGSAIRLKFSHADGMQARGGGPLGQFAIAGEDQKFVWADAKIDRDTVVVSSPRVQKPVAVRYAWADNPLGANLYNAAGLPASPFRTDDWPEISRNDRE